jgi:hypothetical protein
MPLSTRGRTRNIKKAVRINASLHYGFKTADLSALPGVTAEDVLALGQRDLTSGLGLVVFSPNAPKPARFKKRLTGGVQAQVSAIGDGSSSLTIATAAARGWELIKPIKPVSLRRSTRSQEVVIPSTNTLYVAYSVPVSDATPENATLLGWVTALGTVTLAKTVRAPQGIKIPLVRRGSVTLPCASSRIPDAMSEGWKIVQQPSGIAPLL